MPIAPAAENATSPAIRSIPSSVAAAAPGNAPSGSACAAKEAPRMTTKNPTIPAIIATSVETIQVLTMKPANIVRPAAPRRLTCRPPRSARRRRS